MAKTTPTRDLKNRHFIGVMDIEVKTGTIGDMVTTGIYRNYNRKFVKDPETAILVAFDECDERWKIGAEDIMNEVEIVYNPEHKEWRRIFYETTKGHRPTPRQMERFNRGEFVLNLITETVQVMETFLVDDPNLVEKAISAWNEKVGSRWYLTDTGVENLSENK